MARPRPSARGWRGAQGGRNRGSKNRRKLRPPRQRISNDACLPRICYVLLRLGRAVLFLSWSDPRPGACKYVKSTITSMGCAHKQRWHRSSGWSAAGPTLGRQMLSIDNAVGYTRPHAIDGVQKTPAATPLVSRHRSSVGLRWPSKRIAALHRLPILLVLAARCALRCAPMAARSLRHLIRDATLALTFALAMLTAPSARAHGPTPQKIDEAVEIA